MDADIAIIGGGLAGLSAARAALGREGPAVRLFERDRPGGLRTSPLTFTDLLGSHGLEACARERYASFAFHNLGGSSVRYFFRRRPLALLDYRLACRSILRRLEEEGRRLEVVAERVTAVRRQGEAVEILTAEGGRTRARVLIDASGSSRFLEEESPPPREALFSQVYGAFFSGVEQGEDRHCAFLLPHPELGNGGGWYYSVGEGGASFGFARIGESPRPDWGERRAAFERARARFEPFAGCLRGARLEQVECGVIPIRPRERLADGRVVLVGDAAGMATSWSCMGIEPALEYGALAGRLAAEAVLADDARPLAQLQARWTAENGRRYARAARAAAGFWDAGPPFWDWVLRHDLAVLRPAQLLGRLRANEHRQRRGRLLARALGERLRRAAGAPAGGPRAFTVYDEDTGDADPAQ